MQARSAQPSWKRLLEPARRLLRDVRITEEDCEAAHDPCDFGIHLPETSDRYYMRRPPERARGRTTHAITDRDGREVLPRNVTIGDAECKILRAHSLRVIAVRSPVFCRSKSGVCSACYGRQSADGNAIRPGAAVGEYAIRDLERMRRAPLRRRPGFILAEDPSKEIRAGRAGRVRYGPLPEGVRLVPGTDYSLDSAERALVVLDDEISEVPFRIRVGDDELHDLPHESRVLVVDGETVESGDLIATTRTGVPRAARSTSDLDLAAALLEAAPPEWWEPTHSSILEHDGAQTCASALLDGVQDYLEFRRVHIEDRSLELLIREMLRWSRAVDDPIGAYPAGTFAETTRFVEENGERIERLEPPIMFQPALVGVSEAVSRSISEGDRPQG